MSPKDAHTTCLQKKMFLRNLEPPLNADHLLAQKSSLMVNSILTATLYFPISTRSSRIVFRIKRLSTLNLQEDSIPRRYYSTLFISWQVLLSPDFTDGVSAHAIYTNFFTIRQSISASSEILYVLGMIAMSLPSVPTRKNLMTLLITASNWQRRLFNQCRSHVTDKHLREVHKQFHGKRRS